MNTIRKWFDEHPWKVVPVAILFAIGAMAGLIHLIPDRATISTPILVTECSDSIHMHITRVPLGKHMEAVCPANSDFTLMQTGSVENMYFICKCK